MKSEPGIYDPDGRVSVASLMESVNFEKNHMITVNNCIY